MPLREHGRFYFDEPGNRLWGAVFSAVSDAPLKLQPEEVMDARFMDVQDALVQQPCCPDSLKALKLYLASV
ncbi:putative Nudix hydrolase YfcD [compost metagenome]